MSDGEEQLVRVSVGGMVRDQRNNPVVLLKVEGSEEALPIWIGHAEALAIELQMKGQTFERPLTHDLLRTSIESLGGKVERIVVTELRDNTFFAKIFIRRGADVLSIDARPSDSIALALKAEADILVSRDVLDNHKRALPGELRATDPDDDLRRYLKDLDPGDF